MQLTNYYDEDDTKEKALGFGYSRKGYNIILDVDDVILNTSEAIIKILEKRYNLQPKDPIADLKDYNYNSIVKELTDKELSEIFASDEFWKSVQVKEGFENLYNYIESNPKLNLIVMSKCGEGLIARKKELLSKYIDFNKYVFVPVGLDVSKADFIANEYSRGSNIIQVDDMLNNLSPTCKCQILLTNYRETNYNSSMGNKHNNVPSKLDSSFYAVNTLNEVKDVIYYLTEF